jgi:hypothetical protein
MAERCAGVMALYGYLNEGSGFAVIRFSNGRIVRGVYHELHDAVSLS